ncbi:hypothetical protein [Sphingopyxis sp. NJF-3]
MTTPTQTGDKPMVTEADSDRAATWYPHRDAHMHKQLAAMLAAHREAAEKETLSREQSRNVGREALANIVVKLSAIGNVLREAHFALDDSEDLSHQDPPVHAVPFENVMRLDRALRACERFAPDNEAWDGPGPLATQIIERLGGLLTPPASPEQPSPLVLGLERAAQWHDARRKGPDVFEQELHEVSARALRHLAANPDLTDMEALEAGQPSPSPVTGEAEDMGAFVRECIEEARSDYQGYHLSNKPGEPDLSRYDAALTWVANLEAHRSGAPNDHTDRR